MCTISPVAILALQTRLNRALEDLAEPIRAPPLANARQARMIGQLLVNAITDEPANSDVDVGLAHQLAVMHDTAKQACEHQADCDLGIDAGPTIVEAIQVGDLIPQPRKVEHTIDAHEHMVIRNELSQRASDEQLQLIPLLASQHGPPPPDRESVATTESVRPNFFNDPIVHWYRNIFSHVPSTKVREIAAMLKAIHAGEDIVAAREKAIRVIEKLRALRLTRAADLVEAAGEETLAYYAFPEEHWRRIRTNNPLERILREIRRRTRVVGAFPDGQSALNLAAARLRHIAGTSWSTKRYLNIELLRDQQMRGAITA